MVYCCHFGVATDGFLYLTETQNTVIWRCCSTLLINQVDVIVCAHKACEPIVKRLYFCLNLQAFGFRSQAIWLHEAEASSFTTVWSRATVPKVNYFIIFCFLTSYSTVMVGHFDIDNFWLRIENFESKIQIQNIWFPKWELAISPQKIAISWKPIFNNWKWSVINDRRKMVTEWWFGGKSPPRELQISPRVRQIPSTK